MAFCMENAIVWIWNLFFLQFCKCVDIMIERKEERGENVQKIESGQAGRKFYLDLLRAIFVLCKSWFDRKDCGNGFGGKAVRWIGKHSLGIYALHVYVISKLMPVLGGLHIAVSLPLIFVLTVAISAIASMILKLIPLVKKIV